jgi:uncharacterized phage-associated protein
MAHVRFSEAKATEVASRILSLRGGTMHYLKLIKLLYLVDRAALQRWGRPVTTDHHVSMDEGPVVSKIYSLISEEVPPGYEGFWHQHISEPHNYQVTLLKDPGTDELSEAEEQLINEIYAEHGRKNRWKIRDETHFLPEWRDPDGSMVPISYRDIIMAGGKTEDEAAAIEEEIESVARAQALLA